VNVASVLKKMKDKAFARGVNRDDIVVGAAELGIALSDHVAFCLAAMQQHAEELGLAGTTDSSNV
jgi:predicted hydrolase (HD superfamily)